MLGGPCFPLCLAVHEGQIKSAGQVGRRQQSVSDRGQGKVWKAKTENQEAII